MSSSTMSPTTPTRHLRAPLAAALGLALATSALPLAGADSLDDQRNKVRHELAASSADVDEYSRQLNAAAGALQQARAGLARAQARQRAAQQRRAAAQDTDRQAAAQLAGARRALAAARRAEAANQRAVDAQQRLVGDTAREAHQQNAELVGLAAVVDAPNSDDPNQTLQWSTTIFNATQTRMEELQATRDRLVAARQARQQAERQVEGLRQQAADALAASRRAEQDASAAAAAVTGQVRRRQAAEAAVATQLAAEKAHQASLSRESTAVDARIRARIAAQRAAAARAARAARQARTAQPAGSTAAAGGSSWFSAPVDGPITSPYGMRLHPVLHIWKLHDGTDFGVACNTPIHAPRAGVVAEEYYNAGYGNRLMLDHGLVGGHYVTTGYNHATRYVVSVGQHVTKGQLIGYVGTTGYSTGCHLHLMVWQDGSLVNPAATWF